MSNIGEFAVRYHERTGEKRRYLVEAHEIHGYGSVFQIIEEWENGNKKELFDLWDGEECKLVKIFLGYYFGDEITEWWENQGRKEYEEWRRNHEQQD